MAVAGAAAHAMWTFRVRHLAWRGRMGGIFGYCRWSCEACRRERDDGDAMRTDVDRAFAGCACDVAVARGCAGARRDADMAVAASARSTRAWRSRHVRQCGAQG
ncbi:hypothetical protein C2L80_04865 [Rubneribacter badeniensis]|uniref:Uncharacterized protein n=1 Tax=Rubneribacter badeniensis TaxID=2070688 RepID=A0A2K2U5X6_9ACTN|nr:hypothetical protein B5F41_12810 [Gordonibacter sp. An232A]PNV65743.1 hypothetical protein C2L80_04865 [Rubneribacter badeniensis]